jgi:two-component system cell cycle sensor histidine kinase/response regulator CckA
MHTDEAVLEETRVYREIPRGTETVLLVEDDELTRNVTGLVLEELGYRIIEAQNGTQAVEMNQTFAGEIRLLLSDIVMPDGNGVAWSQRLTKDRPSLSTLFISAHSREALQRDGIPDPGPDFLQKPFHSDALARKIREILDR